MFEFFGVILWPLRWLIEVVLVSFHSLFTFIGLDTHSGVTWVLSIVGLVLVVRASVIPLFVKQTMNSRRMLEIGPEMKKIQDKYKNKRDQFSMEARQRETTALYKKHGTSPFASCLPMLVQMPIFFGLYMTLSTAAQQQAGVGMMSQELAIDFAAAEIFGAPLSHSFMIGLETGSTPVMIVAPILVALMITSQFITQLQILSKNISEETKASPTYRMQKIMLYIIPVAFIFSGVVFPLGVTIYWLVSNIWSMGQQFIIIRNMPTPGTPAARAFAERQAKKRAKKGLVDETPEVVEEEPKPTQRVQPVSKQRAKKTQNKKGGRR